MSWVGPMSGKRRFTDEQIIEVLKKNSGVLSYAARALGLTWNGLYNYVQRSPAIQEARAEIDENVLDTAEVVLYNGLSSPDENVRIRSAKHILGCKGRHRGWGLRADLNVSASGQLSLRMFYADMVREVNGDGAPAVEQGGGDSAGPERLH